jgi:hypothetical protein
MANEKKERVNKAKRAHGGKAGGCGIYGAGAIGAIVYYIGHATTFGVAMVGIFKAIFWPAFLIYHVIPLIKM